jgi:hypothetical protein
MATIDFVQKAMWKYLKTLMEEGKFEGLMLPGFGKFIVKEKNREKYSKMGWDPKSRKAVRDNKRILELEIQDGHRGENSEEETGPMQSMPIQPS